MSQGPMIQLTMADYQALVRRVEPLEKIVREQLPPPGNPESEPAPTTPDKVTDIRAYTKELQAKYGKYPSFTQALLADRRAGLGQSEREKFPSWDEAFRDSAVPFVDQLIDENRASFEELARL
ncbi:MAG: hypothetical protein HY741_01175 [Chloroflexi bacterium]|nr:hypothetical protein [Chloroflexota bacterium]